MREETDVLHEKCDIICLSETNIKLKLLPNSIDDIVLNGFHKPNFKNLYRKSSKGGRLVIYINNNFCDSDSITTIELNDTDDQHEIFFLLVLGHFR